MADEKNREIPEDRLQDLLEYCRVEEPTAEELRLIKKLYFAAVSYMAGAGVPVPSEDGERRAEYDLCVDYLVCNAHDVRVTTITGTIVAENPMFRHYLNQLKADAAIDRAANPQTSADLEVK